MPEKMRARVYKMDRFWYAETQIITLFSDSWEYALQFALEMTCQQTANHSSV